MEYYTQEYEFQKINKNGGYNEEVEEGQIPSPKSDPDRNQRNLSRSPSASKSSNSRTSRSSRSSSLSKSRSRSRSQSYSRARRYRSFSRSRSTSRERRPRSYSRSRSRSRSNSRARFSGPIIKDYRRGRGGRGNYPHYNRFPRGRRPYRGRGAFIPRGAMGYRNKYMRDYSRSRSRSLSPKRFAEDNYDRHDVHSPSEGKMEEKSDSHLNPADIKKNQKQMTQSFLAMLEEKQNKSKMVPIEYSKPDVHDNQRQHGFELENEGWQVVDDAAEPEMGKKKHYDSNRMHRNKYGYQFKGRQNDGRGDERPSDQSHERSDSRQSGDSPGKGLKSYVKHKSSSSESSEEEKKSKKKKNKKVKKKRKRKEESTSSSDDDDDDDGDSDDEDIKKRSKKKTKMSDTSEEEFEKDSHAKKNDFDNEANKKKDKLKKKKKKKVSSSSSESDSEDERKKKKKKAKKKRSKKRRRKETSSSSSSEDSDDSDSDSESDRKKRKRFKKKSKKKRKTEKKRDKKKKKTSSDKKKRKSKSKSKKNDVETASLASNKFTPTLIRYTNAQPSIQFSINKKFFQKSDGESDRLLATEYERFIHEVIPNPSNIENSYDLETKLREKLVKQIHNKAEKKDSIKQDYITPSEKRAIEKNKKKHQKELEREEDDKRKEDLKDAPLSTYYAPKKGSYDESQENPRPSSNNPLKQDSRAGYYKGSRRDEISISFNDNANSKDKSSVNDGEDENKKLTARNLLDKVKRKKNEKVSDIKQYKNDKLPLIGKMKTKPKKALNDGSSNMETSSQYTMNTDYVWYQQYYMTNYGLDAYTAAYWAQYVMVTGVDYQSSDMYNWMQQQGYEVSQVSEQTDFKSVESVTTGSDKDKESEVGKETGNELSANEVSTEVDDPEKEKTEKEHLLNKGNQSPEIKQIEVIIPRTSISATEMLRMENGNKAETEGQESDEECSTCHHPLPLPPPPRPKMTTLLANDEIMLSDGMKLPKGTKQIIVHPYYPSHPKNAIFTVHKYYSAYDHFHKEEKDVIPESLKESSFIEMTA